MCPPTFMTHVLGAHPVCISDSPPCTQAPAEEPYPFRFGSADDSFQNFPGPTCAPQAGNSEATCPVGTKHHSSEPGAVTLRHKFKHWLCPELLEASLSICILLSQLSGSTQASTGVKCSVRGKPPEYSCVPYPE